MKKLRHEKIGQVFRVDLKDGYYAFGQVVKDVKWAFFDLHTQDPNHSLDIILNSPVLFKIAVYKQVITQGIWEVIGISPPKEELLKDEGAYTYDPAFDRYMIYQPGVENGTWLEPIRGTWEECKSLERNAVWPAGSVEQRLRDHFAGRPNYDLESYKPGWPSWQEELTRKEFYKQYGYDFHWLDEQESVIEVTDTKKDTEK